MSPPLQAGERVRRTVRNLLGDADNAGTVTGVALNDHRLQLHGMRWGVAVKWDSGRSELLPSEIMVTPVDPVTRLAELA